MLPLAFFVFSFGSYAARFFYEELDTLKFPYVQAYEN